ncbi:hypothetical protein KKB83_05570 [Patescibacteria group bacterium]|nr:hypothetical protein [Patescibacteria group bacterium]
MKKVDYNIEYAHVYTNEVFSREHREAAWIASHQIGKLTEEGKTYSTVVLIDDYNPSEDILDKKHFFDRLAYNKLEPEFVAFEARFVPLKEKVLSLINNKKYKKSVRRYIEKHERVPCSFLIVIWHLLRLGLITNGINYYRPYKKSEEMKSFVGKKLMTILPARFENVEKAAKKMIDASPFAGCLDDSKFLFF